MVTPKPSVQPWPHGRACTPRDIEARLQAESIPFYRWSNGPGDIYPAHDHPYHKVIYVLQGSITFGLPPSGESITLSAGDRLDLPAGISHSAIVGRQGVVCLEGHQLESPGRGNT
jgi:quercetin dioxygenase-like cupin family protein